MSDDKAKEQNPMEALLGKTLLKNGKGDTVDTKKAFADKEIVAFYFSASWCPPCKAFSPVLKEFYNQCSKDSKLEIVYISSDRSIPSFTEYYNTMPWLSLPATGSADFKNALATKFQIRGIPSLIVLDVKTGYFVTDNARNDVQSIGASDKEKCKQLCDTWKAKEAIPVEQAKFTANQGPGGIMGLILTILKNPMYIFGMLYIYKWAMKKFNESQGQPSLEDEGMSDNIPDPMDQQDSEF